MDNYRTMIYMRSLHVYLVEYWQKVCAFVDWCVLAVHAADGGSGDGG